MVTCTFDHRSAQVCVLAILGLFTASCGANVEKDRPPEPAYAVPADSAAAVAELWDSWLTAYERGNPETIAQAFTEDGIYAANTGQLLRGRAEIRDGILGWTARRPEFFSRYGLPDDSQLDVEESVIRFRSAGDAIYRLSRFVVRVDPPRCVMDGGHLLSIWRKQLDSGWRLETLLVNRDVDRPDDSCG